MAELAEKYVELPGTSEQPEAVRPPSSSGRYRKGWLVAAGARVRKTLRLMGQKNFVPLTPDMARDVCERTGGAAVLDGSITALGTHYVLGLRARNCGTGDVLDRKQIEAARKEHILNAVTQLALNFRWRVGESLAILKTHNTPPAEATTSSLEALKAYDAAL